MAAKTKDFFESGTCRQFDWILGLYDEALRIKAESKSSKPENIIKLDNWYQNDLPKKIKSRGKDAHLTHDELVQTIKWKLARGKFRPNLTNLIQMNTPRVVVQETKKAFRNLQKKMDVQAAAASLCNLKGVGPAMASAVLAAGAPHLAPFMADECLWAMPDVDSLDYTMKEYMSFVDHIKACCERLNAGGGDEWIPHKVELAVWTYFVIQDLKPEMLKDLPSTSEGRNSTNTTSSSAVSLAADEASNNGQEESNSDSNDAEKSQFENGQPQAETDDDDSRQHLNSNSNSQDDHPEIAKAEEDSEDKVSEASSTVHPNPLSLTAAAASNSEGSSSGEMKKTSTAAVEVLTSNGKSDQESSNGRRQTGEDDEETTSHSSAATSEEANAVATTTTTAVTTINGSATTMPSAKENGSGGKVDGEGVGNGQAKKKSEDVVQPAAEEEATSDSSALKRPSSAVDEVEGSTVPSLKKVRSEAEAEAAPEATSEAAGQEAAAAAAH